MKTSWQNIIDNNLNSNFKAIIKDGKKVLVSFITWKKIQEIINRQKSQGTIINKEDVIKYVEKRGIIVPYKEKDMEYLYELAEMQDEAKALQEFEKKACEKKVDELTKKRGNKKVSNKDILSLGICSPSEVVHALNYRDLVYGKPEPKKILSNYEKIIINEEKIKDEIEKKLIKKENIIIQGAVMRKIGNNNLLTNTEINNILNKIHIDGNISKNETVLIYKYIDEVRDKRKKLHVEIQVENYNKLCSIIAKTLNMDIEKVKNNNNEVVFLNNIEEVKKQKNDEEREMIERIENDYLESRQLELFYYENFISWMAYKLKNTSYSVKDIPLEDVIEYVTELYLKTYFSYIRKYDSDNKIELSTYLINEITNNYNSGSKGVYAGAKHSKNFYVESNMFVPVSQNEITRNNNYQRLIEKEMQSLTSKLGRAPTTTEIAASLGFSEEDIKEYLRTKELIEQNVESIEDIMDSSLNGSTVPISDAMNEELIQAYRDEFTDEKIDELEEYGIPKTDEGIIPDYMEEEEIMGYDDMMIQKLLRGEYAEKLLNCLSDNDRKIIELRYGFIDGVPKTLEQIAKIYDVTRERIRQIEMRAILKLKSIVDENDLRELLIDDNYYNPMSQETKLR